MFHASCPQTRSWGDSVPFFVKFCLPLTTERYRKLFNKKLRWWHFIINHGAPTVSKLVRVHCTGLVCIYALLLSLWSHSDWRLKAMKEVSKLETENCFDRRFCCVNLNEKENVRNIYLDMLGKAKERRVSLLLFRKGEAYFCRCNLGTHLYQLILNVVCGRSTSFHTRLHTHLLSTFVKPSVTMHSQVI